jgi:hypothetical protein
VGEADEQIDLLAESVDNIPKIGIAGLLVMKSPKAETKNAELKQQQEEKEQKRRLENAKKAKAFADQEFPGEKWKKVEDGIYLSPRKPIGEKSSYKDEKRDAQILRSFGSTVYFVPDDSRAPGNKYDAIVNGTKMEFKNVGGNASTLETQFLRSRGQAPNVFINLEESSLTRHQAISALYGARNRLATPATETRKARRGYAEYNKFSGGKVILKLRGQKNLVYLDVDDLKVKKQ